MPRIGLLSDSHGRAEITRRAVDVLLAHHAELLLHLGDVGSTKVLDALAVAPPGGDGQVDGQVEAHVVFGNTDWDTAALGRYAEQVGLTVQHPAGRLMLTDRAGKDEDEGASELVFCHGHERRPMQQAYADQAAYLCHGHTHEASDTRHDATRVINPGALCRARRYTVAILDTADDTVTFYPVAGR